MDIEQDTPDNDNPEMTDKDVKESTMDEMPEKKDDKDVTDWLMAERQTMAAWLAVEGVHTEMAAAEKARIIESLKQEVPEKYRRFLADDEDTLKAFLESLKDEKPEAPVAPAVETEKPAPEPGTEGFKRNFL